MSGSVSGPLLLPMGRRSRRDRRPADSSQRAARLLRLPAFDTRPLAGKSARPLSSIERSGRPFVRSRPRMIARRSSRSLGPSDDDLPGQDGCVGPRDARLSTKSGRRPTRDDALRLKDACSRADTFAFPTKTSERQPCSTAQGKDGCLRPDSFGPSGKTLAWEPGRSLAKPRRSDAK